MQQETATAKHVVRLKCIASGALLLTGVLAVAWAPTWASVLGALFALAVIVGLWRPLPARMSETIHDDAVMLSKDEAVQVSGGLHRWSGLAKQTSHDLYEMREQIHGVMEQTERAVLNISDCFRNITNKTNEQMENALRLLGRTHGLASEQDAPAKAPSFPEYIRASGDITDRLVEMILAERGVSDATKDAARRARREYAELGSAMLKNNAEVADILARMSALSDEVRKDIYQIIVNLQFQDITHQKLQRVKTPLLDELSRGLKAVAEETHNLYCKLRSTLIGQGRKQPDLASEPIIDTEVPVGHRTSPASESGNKVELF